MRMHAYWCCKFVSLEHLSCHPGKAGRNFCLAPTSLAVGEGKGAELSVLLLVRQPSSFKEGYRRTADNLVKTEGTTKCFARGGGIGLRNCIFAWDMSEAHGSLCASLCPSASVTSMSSPLSLPFVWLFLY